MILHTTLVESHEVIPTWAAVKVPELCVCSYQRECDLGLRHASESDGDRSLVISIGECASVS